MKKQETESCSFDNTTIYPISSSVAFLVLLFFRVGFVWFVYWQFHFPPVCRPTL